MRPTIHEIQPNRIEQIPSAESRLGIESQKSPLRLLGLVKKGWRMEIILMLLAHCVLHR